jgi:hypothetical protein
LGDKDPQDSRLADGMEAGHLRRRPALPRHRRTLTAPYNFQLKIFGILMHAMVSPPAGDEDRHLNDAWPATTFAPIRGEE